MSINKIFILFGLILAVIAGVLYFQFNKSAGKTNSALTSGTIRIKNQTFKVELAKTEELKQKGLSGRDSLPQDHSMLFLFDSPDYYNFWMKDMKFALDILFIKDNKIVTIAENVQPPKSPGVTPPIVKPDQPIDKVLEINAGLSKKYNIKKGDTVEIKLK